jgi:beta-lactamase class A
MSAREDFMDASLTGHDDLFHPTRREFLGALAYCSAGLLAGVPSFAEAAGASPLQRKVNDLVQRLRAKGIIRPDEKTSWSVYDFTTRKKLVAINEDVPRQAASMIKPFVAQAFFFKAGDSRGGVRYTKEVRRTMERMIRRSSNTATNRIMSIVSRNEGNRGPRDVERVLKHKAPGIFRQTRIVETIPSNGRTYRNLASAHDYSRFLYALWNDRLPYSGELRDLMALPNRDRISDGVRAVPSKVRVYDKTGSTARLCGNMGIVEAPGRRGGTYPYTFIGIIEKPSRAKNYGSWITRRSNAIRAVSNLVYLDMKERHRLV